LIRIEVTVFQADLLEQINPNTLKFYRAYFCKCDHLLLNDVLKTVIEELGMLCRTLVKKNILARGIQITP
jgi:hypothetical protein